MHSASRSELRRGLLLLLGLLGGCAHAQGHSSWGGHSVALIELSSDQRRIVEQTLEALGALATGTSTGATPAPPELRPPPIPFATLYGFEFSGPRLLEWWAHRICRLEAGDPWTVAVHDRPNGIIVGPAFFDLPLVDRLAVLIHEARHADPGGYPHGPCPTSLTALGDDACDPTPIGAYAFQAAFLYELWTRGLLDPARALRGYREAQRRGPQL